MRRYTRDVAPLAPSRGPVLSPVVPAEAVCGARSTLGLDHRPIQTVAPCALPCHSAEPLARPSTALRNAPRLLSPDLTQRYAPGRTRCIHHPYHEVGCNQRRLVGASYRLHCSRSHWPRRGEDVRSGMEPGASLLSARRAMALCAPPNGGWEAGSVAASTCTVVCHRPARRTSLGPVRLPRLRPANPV